MMTTFDKYGRFFVTVVSVNWGRGYEPGEFKRNVQRVMRFTDGREHVVILPQELDEEPDPAKEHPVFNSMLEPGTHKVFWNSREPIILSPSFKVKRRWRVKTMGSGQEIDPKFDGVGPARYGVFCVAEFEDVELGFGNTHPHRRGLNAKVDEARDKGEELFSFELREMETDGISGIWGGDMNSKKVPKLVPHEKVAIHNGLDHLRYWNADGGAKITLMAQGSLEGTIDPHDPLWARFLIEAR